MKKLLTITLLVAICLTSLFLISCGNKIDAEGLWENATYRADKSFGKGEKTVTVDVVVEDKSVTFTIKTDKDTLGEALIEHNLIEGEDGPFGLYVKKVNGIYADYDTDGYYWGLQKNGETCMTGVDSTIISDGERYELVLTK